MLKNIEAALIMGNVNRNYLSGFTGDESYTIITNDKAYFITDFRYLEQAKKEVKEYEIIEYKSSVEFFLADLVNSLKIKNLGFEEDILSFNVYSKLKSKLQCNLVPLEGIVEDLRTIKDKYEIEKIQKAASIADDAFKHILGYIKTGITEREIALELEFYMKKCGASALSFTTIAASGIRSSLPHGVATDKKVKNGEFLTLDFGCIYNGYCSDMTRTVVIGNPDKKMVQIYDIVLHAQEMALKAIEPGVSGFDVDKIARDYIKSSGYGDYFGHGLGHGVGMEIHEKPRLSPKFNMKLMPGMVVTDEPGIYIPDFGGVRIEDLVLITEDGYKLLSNSPKDLISL